MPSFRELGQTLALWRRFPGRERLDVTDGCALTFDDGPDPGATPQVLDALAHERASATFFLVASEVARHRELACKIAKQGHEIALHGFCHGHHEQMADPARDLERGVETIEAATGIRPKRVRPPYGRFCERSFDCATRLGLEPVYWSAWGCDWEDIGPERIADLVVRDLGPGAIVLLHDSPRYASRKSASATVAAVGLICAQARSAGLRLCAIEELCSA